jgi:hypothetical protein
MHTPHNPPSRFCLLIPVATAEIVARLSAGIRRVVQQGLQSTSSRQPAERTTKALVPASLEGKTCMFPDEIPVLKCLVCESTWFRETTFCELPPDVRWKYSPDENSPDDARNSTTVLVCLCGQPDPRAMQTIPGRNATAIIKRYGQ